MIDLPHKTAEEYEARAAFYRANATEAFERNDHPGRVRSRHVRESWPHLVAAADHQVIHVAD